MSAYILRSCDSNLQSRGGFQWPESGPVEAPDWNPQPECGNGLHGFLWGNGNGSFANYADTSRWIVAKVDEWVDLGGKVKFPRADVVFVGQRNEAAAEIVRLGATGAVIGYNATAGEYGTATAGNGGTATAGNRGTATAGNGGTATAGNGGTIVIQWYDGNRFRLAVGYTNESVKPNTAYRCERGKFVEQGGGSMTTTETHFNIGGPHGGAWFEAKIQYDYYWDGESGGVSVSYMWFRHPAVKGKPEFEWQENPLLEQLLDTEDLRLSLLEEYEGAARSYAEAAE